MSKQYEEERAKRLAAVAAGLEEPPVSVFVFPMGDAATDTALRADGVSCMVDARSVKLGKKLAFAEAEQADYTVIIGESECAAGTVGVKDMSLPFAQRVQQTLRPEEACALFVRECSTAASRSAVLRRRADHER
jgi:histidyl-tRNA synthetase